VEIEGRYEVKIKPNEVYGYVKITVNEKYTHIIAIRITLEDIMQSFHPEKYKKKEENKRRRKFRPSRTRTSEGNTSTETETELETELGTETQDLMVEAPGEQFFSLQGNTRKNAHLFQSPTLKSNGIDAVITFAEDDIEFHERLGIGGSGALVYRCSIKGFTMVAKILETEVFFTPEIVGKMQQEIKVMMSLDHVNVVKYLGSHINPKKQAMAIYMEYCNESLDSTLRRREGLFFKKKQIVEYATQIARGLNYLHESKILHRDLKSMNIFVTWGYDKSIKTLKIGDFDTSKLVDAGFKTHAYSVIGTPGYMAPEILQHKPYGLSVDIWSYGIVLFEILSLQPPYKEVKESWIISALNKDGKRPNFPEAFCTETYAPVVELFKHCTDLDPHKRPTCKEVLRELLLCDL